MNPIHTITSKAKNTGKAVTTFAKGVRSKLSTKAPKKATELDLLYGTQEQVDLLSYSGLSEHTHYLIVGDTYIRTVYISGFPFVASSNWLSGLVNFPHNVDVSYHMDSIDATLALPKLNRKITELESTKRSMIRDGKLVGPEITDPLDSAVELRDNIQRGQQKLFQVSIYITITADSLLELNKITTLLDAALGARLFYTKVASFQQLEALQSVLPRAQNQLGQKRNLDSSSLALTFPFTSSELIHDTGVLYGINKTNKSLVIIDRFSLNNANSIIFAQSGSGKSYTAKVEILRQLVTGTQVIVIDPEGEYGSLTESLGGTYIRLTPNGRDTINIFDLATTGNDNGERLSDHIQDLTELLSLMAGGATAEELAGIDKALMTTYKNAGWDTADGKTSTHTTTPLLTDFYHVLQSQRQTTLLKRLEPYVKGSLAKNFTKHSSVSLANRLIVFNTKELSGNLKNIMTLAIATFVKSLVLGNPKKRMLVVDEGWMFMEHEQSARFLAGLTRRARKYYLGVTLITQQVNDFLQNQYGAAIAAQSSLRVLLKQDTTTIDTVEHAFHLSEYEQKYLLTAERGEALIIADNHHVATKIVASETEHPLITTNPLEMFKK